MDRIIDRYCIFLEILLALLLASMVVLVFSNVALRYLFNSGITISEELSRWLFVWTTFIGAIVALRRHEHVGTDILVSRLPPVGRKTCLILGQMLMLWVTWLLFSGSLEQARINLNVFAPATGAPLAIVYAACLTFAISTALFLILDLVHTVRGRGHHFDINPSATASQCELATQSAQKKSDEERK